MVGREALGAYVGGLGPLLGPMLAVLDGLKAYVGGPGRSWAEMADMWPKPEREQGPKGAGPPRPPEVPRASVYLTDICIHI